MATTAYHPISTAKIIGKTKVANPLGSVVDRAAVNMLAYQIAVLGLLSCVAKPNANDLRTPRVPSAGKRDHLARVRYVTFPIAVAKFCGHVIFPANRWPRISREQLIAR
jgi:hypothetical protein